MKTGTDNQKLKVLLVGQTSAGKTSLLNQYKIQRFNPHNGTTAGVDFTLDKEVKINEQIYDVAIWDTAGQERFRSIVKLCCRDTDGALICFDLNNPDSAKSICMWINYLRLNCPPHIYIALAGTKCDLEQCYTKDELTQLKEELKQEFKEPIHLFMTSAKTGDGLKDAFQHVYIHAAYNKINDICWDSRQEYRSQCSQTKSFGLKDVRQTEPLVSAPGSMHQINQKSSDKSYCC